MIRHFFLLLLGATLLSCNFEADEGGSLDSLLRSEDSVRIINNLAFQEIDINEVEITNDPDIDFARLMHGFYHAELAASEILLRKGKHPKVLAIANDQLSHHQKDVELFDDYYHNQTVSYKDTAFVNSFFAELKSKPELPNTKNSLDKQYVILIINHHRKGILLSTLYLKHARDPFLRLKARQIMNAHEKEVARLETLLKEI